MINYDILKIGLIYLLDQVYFCLSYKLAEGVTGVEWWNGGMLESWNSGRRHSWEGRASARPRHADPPTLRLRRGRRVPLPEPVFRLPPFYPPEAYSRRRTFQHSHIPTFQLEVIDKALRKGVLV